MININKVKAKLTPLQGKEVTINSNQSTMDIIRGIIDTHKKYESEYDRIADFFYDKDVEQICKNIYDFLKQNVPYVIENSKKQYLRSPSAILDFGTGADCKSYSLFSNGILAALNRKYNIGYNVYYRFAGYSNNKSLEHVFSVVNSKYGEKWIDPVLNYFNSREKTPTFTLDKKVKNMALVQISGIPKQNLNYQQRSILEQLSPQPSYVYYGVSSPKTAIGNVRGKMCGCGCGGRKMGEVTDPNEYDKEEFDAKKVDWAKVLDDLNNILFGSTKGIESKPPSQYYDLMLYKMNLTNPLFRPDVYQRIAGFRDIRCTFDNSTYKWKCIRNYHLNNWAPVERMLWYLQGLNSGEIPIQWVETYADGYGHKPDSDKVSNDESKLPYNLVEVWNDTIKKLATDQSQLNNFLINETITQGYNPANSIKNYKAGTPTTPGTPGTPPTPGNGGSGSKSALLPLGIGILLLKAIM
jgi:hypothetical protein